MSGKKKQESTILPSVCPPHSSGLLPHNKYAASSSTTGNLGKLYSSSPFIDMAVKSFVGAFETPSPIHKNRLVVVEPVLEHVILQIRSDISRGFLLRQLCKRQLFRQKFNC